MVTTNGNNSRRPLCIAVAGVAAVFAVVACDSSGGGRSDVSDVAPVSVEFTHFTSPSGNIACVITSSDDGESVARGVRCDIAEQDWPAPPQPADCTLDYGHAVVLGAGEPARFLCAGDTTIGSGGEPLAYGELISSGRFSCESSAAGIACRDIEGGHGFSISREGYKLF